MNLRRILIALAALSLAATAAAQCARGPTTAVVTLPDFLAVYYSQFRSLSAQDAAEFYGGVCVTAVGGEWTVMADQVRLDELSGDIKLEAPRPTLYMEEWRMSGDLLRATASGLTLNNAKVSGPGTSGEADSLRVELATGRMTMNNLRLEGAALAVRGDLAVLEGTALRVEGAGLTTCIGMDYTPYEVLGDVANVNLESLEVRISGGALRVGRLNVPLRDEIVVSDKTLDEFELPIRVANRSGAASRRGTGLDVRLVGIPAAPGVNLVLGGTGLDAEHRTQPVVLLELNAQQPENDGGTSDVTAVVGVEAGRPYLDLEVQRQMTPWLQADFGMHSGAKPAAQALYEGHLGATATTTVPLAGPQLTTRLTGRIFAALTAVTADADTATPLALGPRLGVLGSAVTTWQAGGGSTFSLTTAAETTLYPATTGTQAPEQDPALQWGVRLLPAWRYSRAPLTVNLSYDSRFTNAASPFGTGVDRLSPLQRLSGSVTVAGQLATTPSGTLSGTIGADADYDPFATTTPAGLKRLLLRGGLTYQTEPWRLNLNLSSEVSGLLATTGRAPYVRTTLRATRTGWPVLNPHAEVPNLPRGTLEFGLMANYALASGAERLDALQLSAAVPLAFDTLELRPYLAVDLATTITSGGAPWLSGYGLDATFITCCGSLTIGVMNDRGAWGAEVGVDLERRPPQRPPLRAPESE